MATPKKTTTTRRPSATTRQRNAVGAARTKPQDHKPKAAPKAKVVDGQLVAKVRNIDWKIPEENFDDFELMGWLHQSDTHPELMPSILERLLGDEQYAKAMNLLRGSNGRVSAEDGIAFLEEIFEVFSPNS